MPHDSQLPSILNPEPQKTGLLENAPSLRTSAHAGSQSPGFSNILVVKPVCYHSTGGLCPKEIPLGYHTSDLGHWFAATYFSNSPVFSYIRLPQNRPIRQRNGVAVQIQGAVVFQTSPKSTSSFRWANIGAKSPQPGAACCLGDFFSVFTLLLYYPQGFNSPSVTELPAFPLGRPANR